jgi:hypothetical protein
LVNQSRAQRLGRCPEGSAPGLRPEWRLEALVLK